MHDGWQRTVIMQQTPDQEMHLDQNLNLNNETLCNKQLLDEAEHDIKNYPDRGQCYLPKPKAKGDNIDRGLETAIDARKDLQ